MKDSLQRLQMLGLSSQVNRPSFDIQKLEGTAHVNFVSRMMSVRRGMPSSPTAESRLLFSVTTLIGYQRKIFHDPPFASDNHDSLDS